jgi:hypothetical protein
MNKKQTVLVVVLAALVALVLCGVAYFVGTRVGEAGGLAGLMSASTHTPDTAVATQSPTGEPPASASPGTSKPTASTEPVQGKWHVQFDTSSFDDSQTVVLALEAEDSVSGWLDTYRPVLVLRCKEHEIDAYIDVGMSQHVESGLTDASTVRVRFDREPAVTTQMSQSTDGEALFFRQPVAMIETMLAHNSMVFEFTPFNAPPVETEFDLRGLEGEIGSLVEACGLPKARFASASDATETTPGAAVAVSPTPFPTLVPTPTPLPSGSPIIVDKWEIRVDRILTAERLESGYSDSLEKARGRFALVFMDVTNRGFSPRTFVGFGHIEILDATGRTYEEEALASAYAMDKYQTDIAADINPDETVHVVSVFDISERSDSYVLIPGLLASESSARALLLSVPKGTNGGTDN